MEVLTDIVLIIMNAAIIYLLVKERLQNKGR